MRSPTKHKFLAAWLCCIVLLVSCSGDTGDEPYAQNEAKALLVLNTSIVDKATRATTDLTSNELMHSLRIVVLRPSGVVEHNYYASLESGKEDYSVVLRVEQNETKKIYLIANEESIDGLHDKLESIGTGSFGFETLASNLTFTADYAHKPIPMSACYKLTVGKGDSKEESEIIEKQMYVVRTATKFTFNFINNRSNDVTVSDLKLTDVVANGSTYLMPHFIDGNGTAVSSENFTVLKGAYSTSDGNDFWIDWLKKVVDNSNAKPDDTSLAESDGWLTGYNVPDDARHGDYNVSSQLTVPAASGSAAGKFSQTPFYLYESKKLKDEKKADGVQTYRLTMKCKDSGNNKSSVYDEELPNLKALFRNTHAVVNVTLNAHSIDLKVDLCPYTQCVLEPVFGL